MFNHAVILAAGKGERMLPLTKYVPKALVKIGETTLLDGVIDTLNVNNINEIHITYGYLGYKILSHNPLCNSLINTEARGNSWFLFNTLIKYINEPIVVVPCDIAFRIDFKKVYKEYIKFNQPPCAIISTNIIKGIDGDFVLHDENRLVSLSRNEEDRTPEYASGIQILNPYKINELMGPKDSFVDVWNELMDKRLLYLLNTKPSYWNAYDKIEQLR